jgi:ABC-type transport system substrate-binding protein
MWSYNDAVEDTAFDPEAAKKLLEEGTGPPGKTTPPLRR